MQRYTIIVVMMLFLSACAGTRPTDLGAGNGKFKDCPDSPNCVSTQTAKEGAVMQPIAYTGDWKTAKQKLISVIKEYPRTNIVTDNERYLHVEFTTKTMRFVDDVEFYFGDGALHFRSASRLGHSDLGVNRKRMEEVKALFEK